MGNAHIVVVDDNPFIVDIISQVLTQEGYTVAGASNGIEGLALIQKIQPDLVLIDCSMPGLNGLEVIQQLRATRSKLRIIMVTANPSARYTALRNGSDDFLAKPFHLKELVRLVQRWLNEALVQSSPQFC